MLALSLFFFLTPKNEKQVASICSPICLNGWSAIFSVYFIIHIAIFANCACMYRSSMRNSVIFLELDPLWSNFLNILYQ